MCSALLTRMDCQGVEGNGLGRALCRDLYFKDQSNRAHYLRIQLHRRTPFQIPRQQKILLKNQAQVRILLFTQMFYSTSFSLNLFPPIQDHTYYWETS